MNYTKVDRGQVSPEQNRKGLGWAHFLLRNYVVTTKGEHQHPMPFSLITTIIALCYLFHPKWYIFNLFK